MSDRRFSFLSSERKTFVRAGQQLNFGWITNLLVQRGEPVFGSETRTRVNLKLDGDNGPRPEIELADFALSSELVKFFVQLQTIGDGVIDEVEIRAGLPRRIVFTPPSR